MGAGALNNHLQRPACALTGPPDLPRRFSVVVIRLRVGGSAARAASSDLAKDALLVPDEMRADVGTALGRSCLGVTLLLLGPGAAVPCLSGSLMLESVGSP